MTIIIGDDGITVEEEPAVYVYIPENFNAKEVLGCNEKLVDSAKWFLDRLYIHSHFGMRGNEFGFTPLKVAYLRRVIPQPFERHIREQLQEKGVIECDGHYIEGRKSYGYRLSEKFQTRHKRVPVRHPTIKENIEQLRKADLRKLSKVHDHLFQQFDRLSIDFEHVAAHVSRNPVWENFSRLALEQLHNRDWTPVVCDYGRFHTPLTRLLSESRTGLRLDGESLINLDIANSQPLFLALLFLKVLSKRKSSQVSEFLKEDEELKETLSKLNIKVHDYQPTSASPYTMVHFINFDSVNEDVSNYVHLVEEGELYDFLGRESSLSRREFKEKLFKEVFFGQNWIDTPLTQEFERLFPSVSAFMRRIKSGNYRRLAWVLQKEESKLMIDAICGRLLREHSAVPILTIHDSILTTEEHVETVRQVIEDEFRRVGLKPTIRLDRY